MPWTTPRTWVDSETVTAAILNTHIRDNLAQLKTSISDDGVTWSGRITSALSGLHSIAVNSGGETTFRVRNQGGASNSLASLQVGTDLSEAAGVLYGFSSNYASVNQYRAASVLLEAHSTMTGGLCLSAGNADVRIWTTGVERVRVHNSTGLVQIATGGAGFDSNYGQALQLVGASGTTGQLLSFIRAGNSVWSMGFDYGTNNLAIGIGAGVNSNFTGANILVRFTPAGAVRAPLQPGFLAYVQGVTNIGSLATLAWTEVYDDGGVFASNTFTAPVDGRYLLSVSVNAGNTSGSTQIAAVELVLSSGRYIPIPGGQITTGNSIQIGGSVIVNLAANETVYVRWTGSNGTLTLASSSVTYWGHFSGRLMV